MTRTVRRVLAVLALVFAVVAATNVVGTRARAATDASPRTDAVATDRQAYVADPPVDPYNNDTLNVHVGAAGGSELARSFVHLALDGLPQGASVTGATIALTATTDQTQNVNTSSAIVQACVLTTELSAQFDSKAPPAFDCSKGSTVGKAGPDGVWTFDLGNLVPFWAQHGNTGAAIVPVAAPEATWSIAFDKTLTAAKATYTPPAASSGQATRAPAEPTPVNAPAPALATGAGSAATSGGAASVPYVVGSAPSASPPAGPPAAGAQPGEAATATPPAARGNARSIPGHRSSAWIWVLLGSLVAAAVLAGPSVAATVTAGAGKVGSTLVAQFRSHGRAMTTSAVVLVWTITYAIYSLVVTPTPQLVGGTTSLAAQGSEGAAQNRSDLGAGSGGAAGSVAGGTGSRTANGGGTGGGGTTRPGGSGPGGVPASEANLPAAARLYSGADDTVGITNNQITLCGHAALTFGPAFNIGKNDINVFWQNLNDHGGIYGRKFKVDWQDDSYMPANAVTAAQTCKDEGTFVLLGGIGFDQIPAVRVWAEQNHELYLHHVAVQRGSEGLRYSFSALPSVEEMGRTFGQLAVQKYRGKKIGVLWRNSSNWQPGRDEFERVIKAAGMQIVGDYPVQNNQGNYTQQVVELKAAGADVVFAWENALASTEMIRQAKAQSYSPHWLLFPFNLTLQTIGADALNPPLDGLAAWPAYTANDHDGPYSSYASDLAEFERQYKQYDPNANLSGPGGDLLFLAWTGFKQLADMFQDCGPDCTRNEFAALMLNGYHKTVTPNCDADFSGGDHHHAAPRMDVFTTTAGPNGQPIWVPTQRCISSLGP
jgi:ABC-type branched-subunit amino acid transport system substrate-binding protein